MMDAIFQCLIIVLGAVYIKNCIKCIKEYDELIKKYYELIDETRRQTK